MIRRHNKILQPTFGVKELSCPHIIRFMDATIYLPVIYTPDHVSILKISPSFRDASLQYYVLSNGMTSMNAFYDFISHLRTLAYRSSIYLMSTGLETPQVFSTVDSDIIRFCYDRSNFDDDSYHENMGAHFGYCIETKTFTWIYCIKSYNDGVFVFIPAEYIEQTIKPITTMSIV